MNNPYRVEVVGMDGNKKIYGCVYKEKLYKHIGIPESWGTRRHAEKYMAECLLFIPYDEYKHMKK